MPNELAVNSQRRKKQKTNLISIISFEYINYHQIYNRHKVRECRIEYLIIQSQQIRNEMKTKVDDNLNTEKYEHACWFFSYFSVFNERISAKKSQPYKFNNLNNETSSVFDLSENIM
jgi:hypothetical protein